MNLEVFVGGYAVPALYERSNDRQEKSDEAAHFKLEHRKVLASSANHTVKLAYDQRHDRFVVVKTFIKSASFADRALRGLHAHQKALESCQGVVVDLLDVRYHTNGLSIVEEWLDGGDLVCQLEQPGCRDGLEATKAIHYARQVLFALRELHEIGIAHRDVKLENCCLKNNTVKLIDFGHATVCDNKPFRMPVGTFAYNAPEVCQRNYFPGSVDWKAADIWSWAVSLHVLLFGCLPWNGPVGTDAKFRAIVLEGASINFTKIKAKENIRFEIENALSKIFKNVFCMEPAVRWSADEILFCLSNRMEELITDAMD